MCSKCGRWMEEKKRVVPREVCTERSERSNHYWKVMLSVQKLAEVIVCDLKVVTSIAEMLLLLSRSIPIDKCLVRNERCKAIETK